MNRQIDGPLSGLRTPNLSGVTKDGAAPVGTFRGMAVTLVADAQSLLQDAAEELSFAVAQKRESSSIAERRFRSGSDLRAEAIERLQRIQDLMAAMPDLRDAKALAVLKEALGRMGRQVTVEDALREGRSTFGDVTEQYLALALIAGELAGDEAADPIVAATVAEAAERLETESGPEIRAGINLAGRVAETASGGLGDTQALRDLYRSSVLGFETLSQTYQALLARYGTERFAEALGFLTSALGDELSSQGPSIPPERLRPILSDLYQLGVLKAVHEECDEALARLNRRFGTGAGANTATLMTHLIPLSNRTWIAPTDIHGLIERLGLKTDLEAEIYVLQDLTRITRSLPEHIFQDREGRQKLTTAVQMALDDAIQREEALED